MNRTDIWATVAFFGAWSLGTGLALLTSLSIGAKMLLSVAAFMIGCSIALQILEDEEDDW